MEQRMNMKANCMDCIYRKPGCHGSCENYLEAKAELEAEKAIIREQKLKNRDIDGFRFEGQKKAMKRQKRGRCI